MESRRGWLWGGQGQWVIEVYRVTRAQPAAAECVVCRPVKPLEHHSTSHLREVSICTHPFGLSVDLELAWRFTWNVYSCKSAFGGCLSLSCTTLRLTQSKLAFSRSPSLIELVFRWSASWWSSLTRWHMSKTMKPEQLGWFWHGDHPHQDTSFTLCLSEWAEVNLSRSRPQ